MNQPISYILLLLQFALGIFSSVKAQSVSAIFKSDVPLTWLGIDFSHARYSGNTGGDNPAVMVEYFQKINKLILDEPVRYDLKKTFHKESVINQLEMVAKINASIDTSQLITTKTVDYYRITKDKIAQHVKNYDTGNLQGLGVIIIIEDLNKTWEQASMWVTYFDMQTREVLLTEKISGTASGLGFRNHWAAPVNEVLNKVQTQEYKKWRKIFAGKK